MAATRLDARLDVECRSRLNELSELRGAPISEVVCSLIDDAYEEASRERIKRARRTAHQPQGRGRAQPGRTLTPVGGCP